MRIQQSFAGFAAILLMPAYFIGAQVINYQTPLNARQEGKIIIAKLKDGDSLFPKIAQIAKEYSIQNGVILFNTGLLRDFSIGQYKPVSKRYVTKAYKLPWELVSLHGTIANGMDDAGLLMDCQATLADSTNATIAGHLTRGIVSVMNQLVILKLSEISFVKKYNVSTGLFELMISK